MLPGTEYRSDYLNAIIGSLLLLYYGLEVCTFIAGLPLWLNLILILCIISAGLVGRNVLQKQHNRIRNLADSSLDKTFFLSELGLWFLLGIGLTLIYKFALGLPFSSGAKVTTALLAYGLFCSTSSLLTTHRTRIVEIDQGHLESETEVKNFVSIGSKLLFLTFAVFALIACLTALLLNNDFVFLVDYGPQENYYQAVGRHLAFVFGAVFFGVLILTLRYSGNLKLALGIQLDKTRSIMQGDYRNKIPIISQDEFGIIAATTNSIATELIKKENHFANLKKELVRDSLTGLYNRKYIAIRVERLFEELSNADAAFSCLMADIDHFKEVNDRYGHDAGDRVLQHCAEIISDGVRKTDIVIRHGGEEFAIFLPGADREDAENLAETIRSKVAVTPCVIADRRVNITISIGASGTIGGSMSLGALIKQADIALYEAKQNGRNRVKTRYG